MPRKPLTPEQLTMAICYATMSAWDFSYTRRLEWEIYAARHQVCSDCVAAPNQPCRNMADLNFNNKNTHRTREVRKNKRPHDSRVDWDILLQGLKKRGYYKPSIEAQVRKQIRHPEVIETLEAEKRPVPDWAKGE